MARLFRTTIPKNSHPDDVRMTLGEHLEELRFRLVRALLALFVGAIVCYIFIDQIMGFLVSPMFAVLRRHGIEPRMVALSPSENFITFLKVAFIVGFILTAPYSLMQIWGFIAAGLYPHERRWVNRFAPASIILFFTGACFLLLIASPLLLSFLVSYKTTLPDYESFTHMLLGDPSTMDVQQNSKTWPTTQPMPTFDQDPSTPPEGVFWINTRSHDVRVRLKDSIYTVAHLEDIKNQNRLDPMMRISDYVVFILQLSAAFGIGFQVPVVVAFIATLGIVSTAEMAKFRRHVIFGMAIVAAVVTPPDVTSMMLLLGPMVCLFEVGLLVARMIEKRRAAEVPPASGTSTTS